MSLPLGQSIDNCGWWWWCSDLIFGHRDSDELGTLNCPADNELTSEEQLKLYGVPRQRAFTDQQLAEANRGSPISTYLAAYLSLDKCRGCYQRRTVAFSLCSGSI